MRIRLTVATSHDRCDVVVEAPAGTDVAAMRAVVAAAAGTPATADWWSGRRLLPDSALLGGPGLRSGDVVAVGGPATVGEEEASPLHLAVTAGPGAGTVLPLGRGVHLVGRGAFCDLQLPDPEVSRRHAAVTVTTAGVSVRDLDSRNGTTLAGAAVDRDGGDLAPDDELRIGPCTVALRSGTGVPAPVRATGDGRLLVLHSADERPPFTPRSLTAPPEPESRARPATAWLAALLPAVAAVGLAWFLHTWQLLAFAALTPVTVLATAAGDRWSWRSGRRRAAAEHAAGSERFARHRDVLLREERPARLAAHPDPARCAEAARGPAAPLWQRRSGDPDRGQVRVGTATRPSRTLVVDTDGGSRPAGMLEAVPVCADLSRGPLALAGPAPTVVATARAVLTQLAVAHPPTDLEFVLLLPDPDDTTWDWLAWLPHRVRRAADAATRTAALAEITDRTAAAPATWGIPPPRVGPVTVLLVDRPSALPERAAVDQVLTSAPLAGVYAVCVERAAGALPAACTAVATADGPTLAALALAGSGWDTATGEPDAVGSVVADQVGAQWALDVARSLAPLDDGTRDTDLPARVRLRDLLDVRFDDDVSDRWSAAGSTLAAVVGVGARGRVELDLGADGPHALVAGTTGSGKSEFLQTWIASLAVAHPPDDLAFLLVDYKGGSAFGACARLPHAVGLVTDLDRHLTARVLRSLEAEIRRRERLFAAADTSDLSSYRRSVAGDPVARLVVVVDEFATLAAELPDFVTGLVDVAQRGRSLGLHLVLATQRPGGAVSPAIRANTSLRVALRVTDAGESSDVIGVPDAAALDPSCPGRAVVRTGHGHETVQVACTTDPVDTDRELVTVDVVGPWDEPPARVTAAGARSDLDDLVEVVEKAWARRFADGASLPAATWVPALPDQISVSELDALPSGQLPIGVRDRPDHQTQQVEFLDLTVGGTLVVAGTARTGRTELLRVVAHGAAAQGAATVVVDPGALEPLSSLATTVARVDTTDGPTLLRLLDVLEREYAARREPGAARPPLVVLIDDATAVVDVLDEIDAGRATERLLTLWRGAGSVGVTVVVTGDRALLTSRTSSAADRILLLRLADPTDAAMAGLRPRDLPDRQPAGRAVSAPDGDVVQLVRAGPPPVTVTAPRTLTELRVRPLPVHHLLPPRAGAPERSRLRLGVGGDGADAVEVDPWAGVGRWLVAGPPRSGRSSTLAVIAAEAADAAVTVAWWARANSPLAESAVAHGWPALTPDASDLACIGHGRALVLLDDVDDLADTALSEAVATAARRAEVGDLAVVCAGRADELLMAFRGVVPEVRRARRGLLLRPGPGDGDLLGIRTGRAAPGAPPGRGVLVADGVVVGGRAVPVGPLAVQVAAPPTPADVGGVQ